MLRRQKLTWQTDEPFNESHGAKHTPYINVSGDIATITVGNGDPYHPMVAAGSLDGAVHFVTHIYVLDQDGGFVHEQALSPMGVDRAQTAFLIPRGVTSLTAYEFCNLHGLWKGPTVLVTQPVVEATPSASTCAMAPVAESAWLSFVADFNRRQSNPDEPFQEIEPYTESDGKKHTPYISIHGTTATVTVGDGSPYHPMVASDAAATVHFVTHIYVLDQAGEIVVLKNLNPENVDKAQVDFTVPSSATSLTAYEFCNKHGLWKGPTVTVKDTTTSVEVIYEYDGVARVSMQVGLWLSIAACFFLY